MQHLYYGDQRKTWHGMPRCEILTRQHPPYERPQPFLARICIVLPGFDLEWTGHQDMRDMRRFRWVDMDGALHEHAAPRETMRALSLIVPRYSGRR